MPRRRASALRCRAACLVALLGLVACGGSSPSAPTPPQKPSGGISTLAQSYLDEILAIMQANSINRSSINWTAFRQAVYAAAGSAQTIPDTYGAISVALGLLGDHHSYYSKPDGSYILNPDPLAPCTDPDAPTPQVPSSIGYVRVQGFMGDDSAKVAFAEFLQGQIRGSDNAALLGWIVDLRGNRGGNMWPMIAGVGPILGEGTVGAFIGPTGDVTWWAYVNGASTNGGSPSVQVPVPYYPLRPNLRAAVLTDCGVASSGEAVAIAFRGRPNTRSFGTPTRGLSTGNAGHFLSDRATLILTEVVMADRNLVRYGVPVVPDEIVSGPDPVVARAIEWLQLGR